MLARCKEVIILPFFHSYLYFSYFEVFTVLRFQTNQTFVLKVMLSFARDQLNAGQLRLSQERIVEMMSVLHAVTTLINGLVRHVDNFNLEFYTELVNLYPILVDCVASTKADPQVCVFYIVYF